MAQTKEQKAALAAMRKSKEEPVVAEPVVVVEAAPAPAPSIFADPTAAIAHLKEEAAIISALVKDAFTPSKDEMEKPKSTVGYIDTLVLMFPRWKRTLVSFTLQCLGAYFTGYAIGYLGGALIIGAAAMAAPTFILYMIWLLTIVAAMYFGSKAASFIGKIVNDDAIGKTMEEAKDKFFGMFKPKELVVASS